MLLSGSGESLSPERMGDYFLSLPSTRTPTFDLSEVGETHLKVQEENGGECLLRADVAINGAIVFVTINVEERGYPILVENASDFSFTLSQAVRLACCSSSYFAKT